MAEIEQVHDLIAAHPTTAPFISRLLIQRFVTSNPSRGYIYRVADRFTQTDGDLGEVLKAILLDYEARDLDVADGASFGKQKEPLLRVTAMLRMMDAGSLIPLSALAPFGYTPGRVPGGCHAAPTDDDRRHRSGAAERTFRVQLLPAGLSTAGAPVGRGARRARVPAQHPDPGLRGDQPRAVLPVQHQRAVRRRTRRVSRRTRGISTPTSRRCRSFYDAEAAGGDSLTAATALVDRLDLYLTGGGLKARYEGAAEPNPRSLMIETVANTDDDDKVRNAVYVVINSPQAAIQR